jgi:hypothetical protein
MEIIYRKRWERTSLTWAQALKLRIYEKVYLEHGVMKQSEYWLDADILEAVYYSGPDETDEQILAHYARQPRMTMIDIRKRRIEREHVIDTEHKYHRNKETGAWELQPHVCNLLYNADGDEIAHEYVRTDLDSSHPDYRSIQKTYYFGFPEEGRERPYFVTMYDENGDFLFLHYSPCPWFDDSQDDEEIMAPEAAAFMAELGFSTELQAWYMNKEFLP